MTRTNAKKKFSVWKWLSNCLRSWLSNLIWRNGAMTPPRKPLTLLRDHLAQLSRTRQGDLALQRFAAARLDVADAGTLFDLVRQCEEPGRPARRTEVVETFVTLAPHDEIAALCALVSLGPELARISRVLAHGAVDLDEAESEVVSVAWQVVARPPASGRRRPGVRDVCNAVWTETRRTAGLRRRGGLDLVALPEGFDPVAPDVDPLERWPGFLAAAVAGGVLTPRQVVIIAQSRMEERPLTEIAVALGRPYDAVCQERWRAESALRKFTLAYFNVESE